MTTQRDSALALASSFRVAADEIDPDVTNNQRTVATGAVPDAPSITITDPGGSPAVSGSGGGGLNGVLWLILGLWPRLCRRLFFHALRDGHLQSLLVSMQGCRKRRVTPGVVLRTPGKQS